MSAPLHALRAGFTLIELLVVVVAIGILAGFALDRLYPLIGRAERVAFMRIQAQLLSALLLIVAIFLTASAFILVGVRQLPRLEHQPVSRRHHHRPRKPLIHHPRHHHPE